MIQIKNASFTYQSGVYEGGIKNIDLQIKSGEVVLLCGMSGCGKTTISRMINGLIPHYYEGELQGDIYIRQQEIKTHQLYEFADKVGSVFQNPRSQFFNTDTASEIAFGCENLGLAEDDIIKRVENVSREMNISNLIGRSLFSLSGGEKQKIACASVSALNPDIYVLDEPTSNLDLQSIESLKQIILNWKKQGKTIVISEHRLYFLKELADKILYIRNGEIEKSYTNKEFFDVLSDEKRQELGLRSIHITKERFVLHSQKQTDHLMELRAFSHRYNGIDALSIDLLDIPLGNIIAVTGHNGAGKTTFSRCLCGLEKKCCGVVSINGVKKSNKERLSDFFMVMQDVNHQLFTESVLEEVLLSMPNENASKAEVILKSLDLLQFKDAHPMSLSGGEKQRVAIACAIASEREFVVFDEPTSGLDYRHMLSVAKNIKMLQGEGKTIFIITHDPEFIEECCTYHIELENGVLRHSITSTKFSLSRLP